MLRLVYLLYSQRPEAIQPEARGLQGGVLQSPTHLVPEEVPDVVDTHLVPEQVPDVVDAV